MAIETRYLVTFLREPTDDHAEEPDDMAVLNAVRAVTPRAVNIEVQRVQDVRTGGLVNGWGMLTAVAICPRCNGSGRICPNSDPGYEAWKPGDPVDSIRCPDCKGTGKKG